MGVTVIIAINTTSLQLQVVSKASGILYFRSLRERRGILPEPDVAAPK